MREKTKQPTFVERMLRGIEEKIKGKGIEFVEMTVDLLESPFDLSGHAAKRRAEDAYWERRRAQQTMYYLRQQKFITTRMRDSRLYVALTDTGRLKLLHQQMQCAPLCTTDECIVVIFDIPERERNTRSLLRRFLKENDFHQLQRSVWVCRKAVLTHFRAFIRAHDAGRWVHAFVGRDVLLR